jgi:hypothetical protein
MSYELWVSIKTVDNLAPYLKTPKDLHLTHHS